MSDAFIVLVGRIDPNVGEPTHWVEAGSRATEADAMRFAQTLRRNDVAVRIFGAHDHSFHKLMADQRATDTAPTDLFAVMVTDKLGKHTRLASEWLPDRTHVAAMARALGGAVVKASGSGPR